jgi:hypothetical protein
MKGITNSVKAIRIRGIVRSLLLCANNISKSVIASGLDFEIDEKAL